ncbi:MAG: hypothetical protein DIU61_011915 [Bacteroidota bacterium]|jgi:hypothetical protein|nr:MAG: hypothetical protein DIU61_16745 [Bacteroidota bacterium]
MKKVLFALLAIMGSVSVMTATANVLDVNAIVAALEDEKMQIQPEELPDAVKAALNSEDYTGWQISAAYKYAEKDIYEVELKKGEEVATVKFDKDGQKVE